MAIEYTVYYRGAPEELRAAMDEILPSSGVVSIGIGETTPLQRDILAEEGFPNDFPVCAYLRLDKFRLAEAVQALHLLRHRLGADKSLFLFQNETELPQA